MANDYFLLGFDIKAFDSVVVPCLKEVLAGTGQDRLIELLRSAQSKPNASEFGKALDAGGQIALAHLIGDEISSEEMAELLYSVGSSLFHSYCRSGQDAFINLTGSGLFLCLERKDSYWSSLLSDGDESEHGYPREIVHACLGPGAKILRWERMGSLADDDFTDCLIKNPLAQEEKDKLIHLIGECSRDEARGIALLMEW